MSLWRYRIREADIPHLVLKFNLPFVGLKNHGFRPKHALKAAHDESRQELAKDDSRLRLFTVGIDSDSPRGC